MSTKVTIIGGLVAVAAVAGIAYKTIGPGQSNPKVNQSDPMVIATGMAVYNQSCASCHGVNLEGQPNWQVKGEDGILPAPPHNKDGHTWHHDDGVLFNYIKGGGASLGLKGFKSGMPPFRDMLDDTQIWAALAYIKSTWPEKNRARQALATQMAEEQAKE